MPPFRSLSIAFFLAAAPVAAGGMAPAALTERSGEQVVQYQCTLCHGAGLNGAPRIGDAQAWKTRSAVGLDNLVRSAIRGRGGMPPSGGLSDLTESELRSAIAYMLQRSGVEAKY